MVSVEKVRIKTITEHSVCLDILPEKSKILDLGCRGFQFAKYFDGLGHEVYSVDMDNTVSAQLMDKNKYFTLAITDLDGYVGIQRSNDPQATKVKEGVDVKSMTLESFSKMVGIEFWDLIKMDIEGSEFNVIMSMTRPMAKQLSIEFHLHTDAYAQIGMQLMERQLKNLGYESVSHKLTEQYGAGYNYWDSLFILK